MSSKHNKIYTGEQIYKNLILSTSKHTHLYFLSLNLEGKLVPNSDVTPVSIPETHLAFHHSTFLRMSFLLARRPWEHGWYICWVAATPVQITFFSLWSLNNRTLIPGLFIICWSQSMTHQAFFWNLMQCLPRKSTNKWLTGWVYICTTETFRAVCYMWVHSFQVFLPCSADRGN